MLDASTEAQAGFVSHHRVLQAPLPHTCARTERTCMAKRRAEDTVLHGAPSKRCCRSLCSVGVQLESMPPAVGVSLSPPSLLALLGGRCRKRPHYFEEPEQREEEEEEEEAAGGYRSAAHCDTKKLGASVLTVQTSRSSQDRRSSSSLTGHKKRAREDDAGSETVVPEANDEAADGATNTEDGAYNSFQYWRVPLPQLDLSLLEHVNSHPHIKQKSKVKDSSSDAMES